MDKKERVVARTQVIENPLEGEQLFLQAMFGVSSGSSAVDGGESEVNGVQTLKPIVARKVAKRVVGEEPVFEITQRTPESSVQSVSKIATESPREVTTRRREPARRPQHYKIVSISLYNEDIERLNEMVRELKRRGHYKANKSQLIRYALANLDLDEIPKDF